MAQLPQGLTVSQGLTVMLNHSSGNCPARVPAPSPASSRLRAFFTAISAVIQDWTPFVLVCCYFGFSISIYMVCNEHIIAIFWFIYLALNFYIAATTVVEAFLSLHPIRQARSAVDTIQAKDWKFPTPDDDLPILD